MPVALRQRPWAIAGHGTGSSLAEGSQLGQPCGMGLADDNSHRWNAPMRRTVAKTGNKAQRANSMAKVPHLLSPTQLNPEQVKPDRMASVLYPLQTPQVSPSSPPLAFSFVVIRRLRAARIRGATQSQTLAARRPARFACQPPCRLCQLARGSSVHYQYWELPWSPCGEVKTEQLRRETPRL